MFAMTRTVVEGDEVTVYIDKDVIERASSWIFGDFEHHTNINCHDAIRKAVLRMLDVDLCSDHFIDDALLCSFSTKDPDDVAKFTALLSKISSLTNVDDETDFFDTAYEFIEDYVKCQFESYTKDKQRAYDFYKNAKASMTKDQFAILEKLFCLDS